MIVILCRTNQITRIWSVSKVCEDALGLFLCIMWIYICPHWFWTLSNLLSSGKYSLFCGATTTYCHLMQWLTLSYPLLEEFIHKLTCSCCGMRSGIRCERVASPLSPLCIPGMLLRHIHWLVISNINHQQQLQVYVNYILVIDYMFQCSCTIIVSFKFLHAV